MSGHSFASLGARHPIHNYEYADAAARTLASGFVASDLGKVAKQLDTGSFWILATTAPTWTAIDASGAVPTARNLTAGAGLTGGGDLSADRTFNVAAHADGSIIVNANDIQVGALATDGQHANRGGGSLHANVVPAGASGFMTGADKTKLDGIAAGAVSAHAALTGLAADDHTQYTKADGTRAFTGTVAGITPSSGAHLATKDYVDQKAAEGNEWQDSVFDRDLATPPGAPTAGDRYLIAAAPTGAWAGQANSITEWDGSAWTFFVPTLGTIVNVDDENVLLRWNGSTWVNFGLTVDHGSLAGLGDDDHTQYHNDTRGDARYFREDEFIAASAGAGDAGKPVKTAASGRLPTSLIEDNAITDAQLRTGSALSVIGRSANSVGNVANIAGANNQVLRVSGSVLGFGTVAAAMIANDAVGNAQLRNSAGYSVIGKGTTGTGDPGDITASADDQLLRRVGGTLAFGASTDALHGNRGGGALHPDATDSVAGFMSANQKLASNFIRKRVIPFALMGLPNADFPVTAVAPTANDTTNSGRQMAAYSDTTEQGRWFEEMVPAVVTDGVVATTVALRIVSKPATAPAGARTAAFKVYYRSVGDNAAMSAWASLTLADSNYTADTNTQIDDFSITLGGGGGQMNVAAGASVQILITRVDPAAGTELAGNLHAETLLWAWKV